MDRMDIFSQIAHRYDDIVGAFNFEEIGKFLPLEKENILLDFGGGTGRAAQHLEAVVNGCIVLDRSYEMLKQATKKSIQSHLIQGLGESLPFRENSIKQIFANDTLHHIKKQRESIEECYKVLIPKGKLIIREFDKRRFRVKLLILFEKIIRFGSKFFSPKELQNLCHEIGFKTEFVPLTKSTYLVVGKK